MPLAPKPLAGYRVLILEDEYLIAMDVEQMCRDHGADDAILTGDLKEAETLVQSPQFDVAVVDVMLRGDFQAAAFVLTRQ